MKRLFENSSEEKSNIFSRLIFSWCKRYVKKVTNDLNEYTEECLNIPNRFSINKKHNIWKDIEGVSDRQSKKQFILNVIKAYRTEYILYILLGIFTMSLSYSIPMLFPIFMERFSKISNANIRIYYIYVLIFASLQFLQIVLNEHYTHVKWKIIISMEYTFRDIVFNKILYQEIELNKKSSGEILNLYSIHISWLRGILAIVDIVLNCISIFIGAVCIIYYLGIGGIFVGINLVIAIYVIPKILSSINVIDGNIYNINDKRLTMINEIISNIREIKLFNLQKFFIEKINLIRKNQLFQLKKKNLRLILASLITYSFIPISIIISIIICVYTKEININSILASFILFNIVNNNIKNLLVNFNSARQFKKSFEYIQEYIVKNQKYTDNNKLNTSAYLEFINASFLISNENKLYFNDINLKINENELAVITGEIGSGKSTLIKLINNEFELISGKVSTDQSKSFISEEIWMLPISIRDNIVLERNFDEEKYNNALELAQLKKEIQSMKYGDKTILADGMTNISGGQQKRIALARAIYRDENVVLIDDILNSFDPIVRENIINDLIINYWSNKTRILITNDQSIIVKADKIIKVNNFSVETCENRKKQSQKKDEIKSKPLEQKDKNANKFKISKNESKKKYINNSRKKIFTEYIFSIFNKYTLIAFLLLFILSQIIEISSTIIFSYFKNSTNLSRISIIYGIFAILVVICNLTRFYIIYNGNLKASEKYHKSMIEHVLNADMMSLFKYDKGEILARFSNDIKILDNDISKYISSVIESIFALIVTGILIIYSSPIMIILILIFSIAFISIQKEVRKTGKVTARQSNAAHEPCIQLLELTREGSTFIKDNKLQKYISNIWRDKIENALDKEYTRQSINRYLLTKLKLNGVLIMISFLLLLPLTAVSVKGNLVKVTLMYCITIISSLEGLLRDFRHAEIGISSLERIDEILKLKSESQNNNKIIKASNSSINIINFKFRFDNNHYLINDLNLNLKQEDRLLITGRTGCGKTTFLHCIIGLYNYEGDIFINGYNLRVVSKESLRNTITFITQRTFIFKESIRKNLDPYSVYSDEEIYNALRKTDLFEKIIKFKNGIDTIIDNSNSYLSYGERQLLILSKAMLNQSQILFIDEGISQLTVDKEKMIYRIIDENFKNNIIIGVSHKDINFDFYTKTLDMESLTLENIKGSDRHE